jgi:siroheme synthase
MPGQNYSDVAKKLKESGLPGETPCAVISRATTPHQRTQEATIGQLSRLTKLAAPTLLVVGEVVRFADPISLTQEFGMPDNFSASDPATVLFANSASIASSSANEEPVA